MSAYKHGGPAFPATTINDGDINAMDLFGTLLPPHGVANYPGMTLRDYFAAKAMQAFMTHGVDSTQFDMDACIAYLLADAMLKARQA